MAIKKKTSQKKKRRITKKDAKQINEYLKQIDAILEKYDDYVDEHNPHYVTSFCRMISGYDEFKHYFSYWSNK